MMVITGKIKTVQTLHGCKVKGIPGPQWVVEHVLEHCRNILRSDLGNHKIGKASERLQSRRNRGSHFFEKLCLARP